MLEAIAPLWTYGEAWQLRTLVIIVFANMVLAIQLYGKMSKARFKAVKEGRATSETYRATQNEPEDAAVFNRAVMNQFESPVLFYATIAIALALETASWLTVLLAGLYVFLRFRHAREMTGEHVVLKRRAIFIQAFKVLMVLMAEVFVSAMIWA